MTAGRPKTFEDTAALDQAIEIFCKKGYEAASLDDLLKSMKLGKGSMYHFFGSKRELFQQALNRYVDRFLIDFSYNLEISEQPLSLIREFFISIADERTDEHKKGCFMGNSVVGLSGNDVTLTRHAMDKLKSLEDVFYINIRKAQMLGQFSAEKNARLTARLLITFWNGINVTRRVYPDNNLLREIIELQLNLILN
jgi:TetR/AcrR family transcriptional repressor of nem operon